MFCCTYVEKNSVELALMNRWFKRFVGFTVRMNHAYL